MPGKGRFKRFEKILAANGVEVLVFDEKPEPVQVVGKKLITVEDPRLANTLYVTIFVSPLLNPTPTQIEIFWANYGTALEALIQSRT